MIAFCNVAREPDSLSSGPFRSSKHPTKEDSRGSARGRVAFGSHFPHRFDPTLASRYKAVPSVVSRTLSQETRGETSAEPPAPPVTPATPVTLSDLLEPADITNEVRFSVFRRS